MNEQTNGQLHAPSDSSGHGAAGPAGPAGFGEAPRFTVDKSKGKSGIKNEAVLGPFTVRDLTVFGATLILFVASLIPMFAVRYNLWNLGSLFFLGLGILLPLLVSALFVARRVSPGTKLRIGSLSVDQFASVVASFTVAFFFLAVAGAYVPSMLLGLVGALVLLVATVLARLIPPLAGDFLDRDETPAHVVARDAKAPVRKPRAPKAPQEPKEAKEHQGNGTRTVAGWAKRMGPGGSSVTAGSESRSAEPRAAAAKDTIPGAGAGAGAGASAAASSATASQASPAAPATQVSGVVPAAGTAGPSTAATPKATPAASAVAASAATGVEPTAASAGGATGGPGVVHTAANAESAPSAAASTPTAAEQTRAADVPATASASAPTTVNPQVRSQEPIGATVDPAQRLASHQVQPVHEAFWFAVAQPRTAVDEVTGAPAFVIEPGGWVLALEDRGTEFLVQHTDGRVGVLRDLSNIERG
jgi:hypothetical protein